MLQMTFRNGPRFHRVNALVQMEEATLLGLGSGLGLGLGLALGLGLGLGLGLHQS